MTTYFGSKPTFDWNPNGSAESGHDFINQINEQKGNIENKTGEYQQAKTAAEGADKQFSDMFQNRQQYSDMYNQAAQQAKVDQREQEYQKNLDALNATRRAMYVLPSATNANSEVRLSQAQRDAALNRNLGQYQNLYNENSNLAQQAGSMYQTALNTASTNAGQMLAQQNQDINTAMADYQTKLQAASNEYDKLLQERNLLRSIYGDMYDDEYNHRMQEIQIWADNLQAETARYQEQQANYRAQLAKQLSPYEQYLMDKDKAETAKAEAAAKAQQEAAKAAKEAEERAKANPYKNTYATNYAAKNPLEWLATGGPVADVFEHGMNWLSGSNVGSYGRYGR